MTPRSLPKKLKTWNVVDAPMKLPHADYRLLVEAEGLSIKPIGIIRLEAARLAMAAPLLLQAAENLIAGITADVPEQDMSELMLALVGAVDLAGGTVVAR